MSNRVMKIWLLTDTHFGHAKLLEWGRPEGYEERIFQKLKMIKAGDTLYHLGDFCIGKESEWHKRFAEALPEVRKILIRGNHDHKSNHWYYAHGWDFVAESVRDRFYKKNVVLSHKPLERQSEVDINIHGHLHGNTHRNYESKDFYDTAYHRDIAPDITGYKPLDLQELLGDIQLA